MPVFDLTHRFDSSTPFYPGDPKPLLRKTATLEENGFVDFEMRSGMHIGTHMDGPLHMIRGGKSLAQIPVERFRGPGILLDARGKEVVEIELLEGMTIPARAFLLILTGQSQKYRTAAYHERRPVLSEAFAECVASMGISAVGIDAPGPDREPYPVHKILLSKEILIIENLANLEALLGAERFEVIALPLKLETDSAPARVIAITSTQPMLSSDR
ncbi:MAG: cyclase family protein [Candidatus Peregrinibacteria bacterium]